MGVYWALHEAGVELDRIIGTSIGAINAAIIAGNRFAERLAKLDEFGEECNAQALAVCIGRAGPRRTVETHDLRLDAATSWRAW